MSSKRKLTKVYTPLKENGFLGEGHTARFLVNGNYTDTDPFIYLMDDDLDKKNYGPAGGPHPHAGFETVSLLIDGAIVEMLETMKKGDFQIMTAGSGIIHTETIHEPVKGRLFQLWLNLPKEYRWTTPRLQILNAEKVPVLEKRGVSIRLYSGSLEGISSPVQNYVSLIIAEINMQPGSATTLTIPGNFNCFIVALSGGVEVGEERQLLAGDQVGWLDRTEDNTQTELILKAGMEDVRLILYAAKPLGEPFVSHGPFIADNSEQIQKLYQDFRSGEMKHISEVPTGQRITY